MRRFTVESPLIATPAYPPVSTHTHQQLCVRSTLGVWPGFPLHPAAALLRPQPALCPPFPFLNGSRSLSVVRCLPPAPLFRGPGSFPGVAVRPRTLTSCHCQILPLPLSCQLAAPSSSFPSASILPGQIPPLGVLRQHCRCRSPRMPIEE